MSQTLSYNVLRKLTTKLSSSIYYVLCMKSIAGKNYKYVLNKMVKGIASISSVSLLKAEEEICVVCLEFVS